MTDYRAMLLSLSLEESFIDGTLKNEKLCEFVHKLVAANDLEKGCDP